MLMETFFLLFLTCVAVNCEVVGCAVKRKTWQSEQAFWYFSSLILRKPKLKNENMMIRWVEKICGNVYSYEKGIDAWTEIQINSLKAYTKNGFRPENWQRRGELCY